MKEELTQKISVPDSAFEPFIITTLGGFSFAVQSPKRILLGRRVFVVADWNDRLHTIPYRSVASISEYKPL